jgi:hypothetical protein
MIVMRLMFGIPPARDPLLHEDENISVNQTRSLSTHDEVFPGAPYRLSRDIKRPTLFLAQRAKLFKTPCSASLCFRSPLAFNHLGGPPLTRRPQIWV